MSERDIDEVTGVETTGHEWDGIKELNNPLPRWWLWTFYASIVFAIGYTIAFPAWLLISAATPGLLGYSSRADHATEIAAAKAAQGETLARIAQMPVGEIFADQDLARFASAGGRSLFKVYCSQCHGTGATGAVGYPNLNDDEWIWGGTIDEIYTTIAHGARSPTRGPRRRSIRSGRRPRGGGSPNCSDCGLSRPLRPKRSPLRTRCC